MTKPKDSWGNFGKPQDQPESAWKKFEHITMPLSNFHKGGRVKKTGVAYVHKGELVLTSKQQKAAGLKKGGKKKVSGRKRVASKG
jgi:hypothetical protein